MTSHKRHTTSFSSPAFTLVELLIVIVVIAILATISIVGYNGIQERARAASVSTALSQASQKIALWQVDNPGTTPTTLSDVGIANTDTLTYQYSQTNNTQDYCITATTGPTSYYLNSTTQRTPTKGGCPGHGQGGSPAITNLAVNPSVESNAGGWGADFGPGGAGNAGIATGSALYGNNFYRLTWTTGSTQPFRGASTANMYPLSVNQSYSASVAVRTSRAQGMMICILFVNNAGSGTTQPCSVSVKTVANSWTTLSVTGVADSAATGLQVRVYASNDSKATNWIVGDTLDVDGLIIVQSGSIANFADGNSPNWIWNGAANNSTSTGPAK